MGVSDPSLMSRVCLLISSGRFTGETDPLYVSAFLSRSRLIENRMHKFNRTINIIGKDMYKVDIQGSVAYAKGLARAGILKDHEESEMIRGLKLVEEEWDQGVVSETLERSLTSVRHQRRR
jgi:hypothetical protein